jgi:hypothetical protein
MRKYLIFLLIILCLCGCRKSSRNNRNKQYNNVEKVENEKRERSDRNQEHDNSTDDDNDMNVTPHSVEERNSYWSQNGEENISMIKSACDYKAPKTKGFANKLAGKAHHSDGYFNIEQICSIFSYCRGKWEYVNDPKGEEYLAKSSETIASSLTGDCDDFAVLLASCMLAVGGDVCIVTAFGNDGGHAYAEVDVSEMNVNHVIDYIKNTYSQNHISNVQIRKDKGRMWLNLDWQASYPGGPLFKANIVDYYYCINGSWSFN